MSNNPFIGIGHNPEGVDLPLGFGMRLAQEPRAIDTFGILDEDGKARVVSYIQGASTGEEAKDRIENAVTSLSEGRIPS